LFYVESLGPGSVLEDRKCEACGRSGHPATFQIQFGGNAYHKETLDEVDNDHDEDDEDDSNNDDDDEDDDNASVNSSGQAIPSKKKSWNVGR
jgi:hypothetical protein